MTTPERVVVIGASGFGRETLDVLEAMRAAGNDIQILGVIDDAPSTLNLERLADRGITYLGKLDGLLDVEPHAKFLLGIGNPKIRKRLVETLESAGWRAFTAIHPTVSIGSRARIEEGVVICAGAVLSTNVTLGRHVQVNPNVTIGHDSWLGNYVSINPGAIVSGEVTIHDGVLIGAGATVLQQLAVGSDSLVGAAALVTRGVPEGVTVTGIPGRWDKSR